MRIIKALIIFWLGVVPLMFLILMFGPMFTKPKPAPEVIEKRCDADCMDRLLSS